ncbi:permease-like cell division protein FtsX [Nocardioides sp. GY 10127]|uniref:permease-like cell division protein FtsX n=1 Tax=Nocardioides sp. GY 10127 TaxID=2569762 RepID=UPI0010A84DC4|nr:permease-like cell division protein FtsX [Nocardioides sp. GY 10127]TIC81619.1 ABC transporter permease [Nocardioides sp. GY 10127]
MRYVLSNLGQGLRRNLSMHLAVVLTLFVSLTLVGIGLLVHAQAQKVVDQWGSELQITVWLCRDDDSNAKCLGAVTKAEKQEIEKVLDSSAQVDSYEYESKAEAFEKVKALYGASEADRFEGPNAILTEDDMAESIWITLKDPDQYEAVTSAVTGLDGVSSVRDQRDTIAPLLKVMDAMQIGSIGVAAFLVLAALLLVANTIRLTAFARRKEIAIMRLVGASSAYIALPFLLEALVTALVSVGLAVGTLGGFMYFGVMDKFTQYLGFIPWIDWSDWAVAAIAVAILGPVLSLVPTLLLTSKYLKV